jgi:hypothetical protein
MSKAVLDRLTAERDEARSAAIALAEADDFDPANETFVGLEERATSLDSQIQKLVDLTDARSAADALDGRMSKAAARDNGEAVETRSWGQQFIESDAFTGYRRHGTTPTVEAVETRALPTGIADLVAAGLKPTATSVDVTAPRPPTVLSDNVNTVQVASNAVEFVSWKKVAGGAAVVGEKLAKPSAEWAPTVVPATLENIAVYTQLTRQMIEDFGAVRSYIDGELRWEVAVKEESQIAVAIQAATLPNIAGPAGAGLLGAVRMGMVETYEAGYPATAVMMNPADAAAADLEVMGATVAGPVTQTGYWGLTVIQSSAQPAGTAIVGNFRMAVSRFVRSGIGLYVTDSHADTFLTNVFTLLAERRSKSAVIRPAALCEVTAGA